MPGRERRRHGVVAIALDDPGYAVLDVLRTEAREWNRPLSCYRQDGLPLRDILFAGVGELPAAPDNGGGMPEIDLVHLIFITAHLESADLPVMHAAITDVRQRFRSRVGRAILAVLQPFEPVGLSMRAQLTSLPGPVEDLDPFDAVVLLDTINTRGLTLPSREAAAAGHAAAVAQVALTDLSPSLHQMFEQGRTSFPAEGMFVSLGAAKAAFSAGDARSQIADVLYDRMARRLVAQAGEPAADDVTADPWPVLVEEKLLAGPVKPHDSTLIERLHNEGNQTLKRAFAAADHHVGFLLETMRAREQALRRVRDRCRFRLEQFMDEFAPWYLQFKLGKLVTHAVQPIVNEHHRVDATRAALLAICLLGITVVLFASLYAGAFPGFAIALLALFGMAGIGVLIAGLSVREVTTTYPAVPPRRDMLAELDSYRAAHDIAVAVLEHHSDATRAFCQEIERLHRAVETSAPPATGLSMELPGEVIDVLLERYQIDAPNVLRTFWAAPPMASAPSQGAEPSLAERLKVHATAACAGLSDLRMGRVLGLLGLEHEFVSRTLDRLQRDSAPWIPVPGRVVQTVVAIPQSVTPQLRQALLDHLGKPAAHIVTSQESLVVVQWTQGFAADRSTPGGGDGL